jgi:hypothetical protein
MKNNLKSLLLSIVFMLSASANVFAESPNQKHNHEHENTPQSLSLNSGVKWQIDQSLHLGMSKIKKALLANLDAIHYNKFSAQQYLALAKQVDQQLNYLFEHCKLPTQADAQLHILLAKIMRGSAVMKNSEGQKQGAVAIIQALQDYPVYFNDAHWAPLMH